MLTYREKKKFIDLSRMVISHKSFWTDRFDEAFMKWPFLLLILLIFTLQTVMMPASLISEKYTSQSIQFTLSGYERPFFFGT